MKIFSWINKFNFYECFYYFLLHFEFLWNWLWFFINSEKIDFLLNESFPSKLIWFLSLKCYFVLLIKKKWFIPWSIMETLFAYDFHWFRFQNFWILSLKDFTFKALINIKFILVCMPLSVSYFRKLYLLHSILTDKSVILHLINMRF